MVITSLKDMDEIRAANILNLPKQLSFYSWPKAWSTACTGFVCEGLKPGFFNSIKITVPSVIVSVGLSAINGYALGGGLELALCCHIRIASKVSKMGLPETSLGIIPGYGGTQRLAQIVGRGIANEMILTGSMINSSRALSIGLISKVVNSDELIDSAIDISKKILINSPFAISKAIKAINFGFNHNKNGLKKEIELFSECFDSEDFNEGTNAFIEKRKPNFIGK